MNFLKKNWVETTTKEKTYGITKGHLLWFISAQSHKIRINSLGLYTQNRNRVSPVISGSGETSVMSQVCPEANTVSKTHPVMTRTLPRRKASQGLARSTRRGTGLHYGCSSRSVQTKDKGLES